VGIKTKKAKPACRVRNPRKRRESGGPRKKNVRAKARSKRTTGVPLTKKDHQPIIKREK